MRCQATVSSIFFLFPAWERRIVGGKGNTRGTPQGGVASPLLASIYMNRFLKHWRLSGCGEAFRAGVVSYADDFVILSRGRAAEALAWTKAVMTRLGQTINKAKTSLKDARQERFDFLGYSFGPHHHKANGKWYLGASPYNGSRRRCAICWCPTTSIHGWKCVTR
jgi:RNA-directed DNA polymerase